MTQSLISIVTPCLNRAEYVREAVESVLIQNYPNVEHIVMDGGSTDGTLDILRAYPHLHVVSEPDQGMYDAINKGLRMAKGEIIGLLNTDDIYLEGCFKTVADVFEHHPDALAVVGGITTFHDDPAGRRTVNTVPAIEPGELWFRLIQGPPVTNAWFFRPAVFKQLGYFDTRSRYSSDRYFLIHVALDGGVRPTPIRQVLYAYRQHAGSVTITDLDGRDPKYGAVRMKILQEDLGFLEDFLNRPHLPAEVRQRMRHEHSVRCYRLAATAFYHRRFALALSTLRRGFQRNLLLPFIFTEMAIHRLKKEISGYE